LSSLLANVRDLAEEYFKEKVGRAVVTVPVTFDDDQIKLLRRAGQMAGLDVVAVIDEPSAAALANRFSPGFGGVVGVYDFGGGTFDFSVVDVSRGDFQVLATAGDTWLGGDDFDLAIAEAVANQYWHAQKVDLRNQQVEWQQLLFACEQAKRQLSSGDTAVIFVPEILRTPAKNLDFRLRITRPPLERVWAPVIERSLATCNEALSLLELQPGALSAIYLSGGTTHIPAVRTALARRFGVPVATGVSPEHAVCLGACVDTQTDAANCGGCGKRCPTGQACAGGACACTSGPTCSNICCTGGNGCCLTGCQIEHDTGFQPVTGQGQTFFDCNAAGSAAAARAAAEHFAAGTPVTGIQGACVFGESTGNCVAWQTLGTPQSCGVWCFTGNVAGKATVTQGPCLCPDSTFSVDWH